MKTASPIFRALIVSVVLSSFILLGCIQIASVAEAQANGRFQKRQRKENVTTLPAKSKRYALVIGVSKYRDSQISPLRGADNDAKSLAETLKRYADFPEEQVILLATDQPEERHPTRANIFERLHNLAGLVPKDGLLLVSFAGHGIERNEQAFLIPSDGKLASKISLLEDTAISVTRMKGIIQATGVRQVIVMLDACRDLPTGRGMTDNLLSNAYVREFNFSTRNSEVEAVAILYATAIGERAYEYSEKRQGYFTWYVVEALSGKAANEKGEVTLAGLKEYLEEIVPKRVAIDLGKQQRPWAEIAGYKADQLVIAAVPPRSINSTTARPPVSTLPLKPVTLPEISNKKLLLATFAISPVLTPIGFSISTPLTLPPAPPPPRAPVRLPETRAVKLLAVRFVTPPMAAPLPPTFSSLAEIPPPPVGSVGLPLLSTDFEIVEVDAGGRLKNQRKGKAWGFSEDLGNGIRLEMIEIPGGRFAMGSQQSESGSTANERPQHEVSMHGFAMSKYEVTQEQWRAVASLPKARIDLNPDPSYFKGNNLPAEQVSWEEAVEFCERLSQKTKRAGLLQSRQITQNKEV